MRCSLVAHLRGNSASRTLWLILIRAPYCQTTRTTPGTTSRRAERAGNGSGVQPELPAQSLLQCLTIHHNLSNFSRKGLLPGRL